MNEPSPVRGGDADSLIGLTVDHGRYEIVKLIGEGGMGRVFQARQISMNRMVALKLLRAQLATDPNLLARFEQEALSVSKLRHPNTITVYDYGRTEDGYLFIAMELLGGRPLSHVLREERRIALPRALHIMEQVVGAVAEAHTLGIVHRDLKPENIQLDKVATDPDFAKVLDFGIAKIIHGEEQSNEQHKTLTMAGAVFGTPHYMSPEQVHGLKVDHRADLYALGVILYELLAGRPPFDGATPMAVMMAQASKVPPDIRQAHPDAPVTETVADLIAACLVKDRDQRIQSAAEMLAALRQAKYEVGELVPRSALDPALVSGALRRRSSTPSAAVPPTPSREVSAPSLDPLELDEAPGRIHPTSTSGEVVPLEEAEAPPRSRRGLSIALAAGVVVAGVAAWLVLSGDPPKATTDSPPSGSEPVTIQISGEVQTIRYRIRTTPPGAQVTLGDKVLGTTPLEHAWPAGEKHELKLTLAGHEALSTTLPGEGPGEQTLDLTLKVAPPASAWFKVRSTPPGAEVYDGEKLIGTTPFDWRPASDGRKVALRFVRAGSESATREVALVASADGVPVDVELPQARAFRPRLVPPPAPPSAHKPPAQRPTVQNHPTPPPSAPKPDPKPPTYEKL